MPRVLFLCTGNTCRSPLAEVFAAENTSAPGVIFESAGLQVSGPCPASAGSLQVAAKLGLDLSGHHSRALTEGLLDDTAWVIGMTRSHVAIFRSRFGHRFNGKLGILGAPGVDLARVKSSPECEEVDDPYNGPDDKYDAVGSQIRHLVRQWAPVFAGFQS